MLALLRRLLFSTACARESNTCSREYTRSQYGSISLSSLRSLSPSTYGREGLDNTPTDRKTYQLETKLGILGCIDKYETL